MGSKIPNKVGWQILFYVSNFFESEMQRNFNEIYFKSKSYSYFVIVSFDSFWCLCNLFAKCNDCHKQIESHSLNQWSIVVDLIILLIDLNDIFLSIRYYIKIESVWLLNIGHKTLLFSVSKSHLFLSDILIPKLSFYLNENLLDIKLQLFSVKITHLTHIFLLQIYLDLLKKWNICFKLTKFLLSIKIIKYIIWINNFIEFNLIPSNVCYFQFLVIIKD